MPCGSRKRATWQLSDDGRELNVRMQTRSPQGTAYIKMAYEKERMEQGLQVLAARETTMRAKTYRLISAIGIVTFVLTVAVVGGGTDFSGTWVLNEGESEWPNIPGMDSSSGASRRFANMTVTQTDSELKVVTTGSEGPLGNTREQTLKPGAGPQQIATFSGDVTLEADWEDGKLVVKRLSVHETPRGDTIKVAQRTTWELSADGRKVTQRMQIKNRQGTSYVKLVYDKQ